MLEVRKTMRLTVAGLAVLSLSMLFYTIGETAVKDSLVFYLPFDEGKDDTAEDKSGNGNNGAIKGGAKWVDGKSGKALEFNGADSFVEVQHSDSLNLTAELTVAGWLNVHEKVQYGGIIDKWEQAANSFKGYLLQSSTGYAAGMLVGSGGAYVAVRLEDAPLEEWIHIAMTWDGKTMTAYLNGKEYGAEDVVMQPAVAGPMFIGKRAHGANAFFKGVIDELAIFNKALSPDEIQSVMNGVIMAVYPSGKAALTWGALKNGLAM